MKKVLLAGVALATISAGTAMAADMQVKAQPAPFSAAYNWTGCYIGGNVGGAWGNSNINIPNYPANFDLESSSLIGGVHAGCNYMFPGGWVIGIEGDYDWTDLKADASTIRGPVGERFSVRWDSTASVRGRLGYAFNNTLLYITGGGAWAHLDEARYIPLAGGVRSATFDGWVFGGGFEHAVGMSNWIIGIEYLHADYGRTNFFYVGPTSVSHTVDVVRGRLSYKF
jgi:outer membrane immunogenic protein